MTIISHKLKNGKSPAGFGASSLLCFLLAACFLTLALPAFAACTNPAGNEGDIVYNNNYDVFQGCTPGGWMAFQGGVSVSSGLTGPSGCAAIGDLCADGTVFAGWHPITYAHLFIPTVDQEQPGAPGTYTMNWKNATGTNDISTDSDNDGEINHANRGGAIGDFQAFQTCEDLSFGGQTDWYLPSRVELVIAHPPPRHEGAMGGVV